MLRARTGNKQKKNTKNPKVINWCLTSRLVKEIQMTCHFTPVSRADGGFVFYDDKPGIGKKWKKWVFQP